MRPDEPIREAIAELVGAWNCIDAPAFGELFTEDAEYIGTDGVPHRGRSAIEALVPQPKHHIRVRIEEIVSIHLDADRAEAQFRWLAESGEPARRGLIHCLLVQQVSGWRIQVLRNTASS
jgi:uncharacterized protein (TIGR02246 family)